jgi:hypothetical protein
MTIEGFALAGTALFAVGAIACGTLDWLRTNRRHRDWVDGLAVAEFRHGWEQEWLDYGHARDARDEVPEVVEDWELHEDAEVAALEAAYGPCFFENTGTVLKGLAEL